MLSGVLVCLLLGFIIPPLVKAEFLDDCLASHNKYRAKHSAPPLKLDDSISEFAKEWAETIAGKNVMEHRPDNKYGENLYMSSASEVTCDAATTAWYDEIKDYNFKKQGFSMGTGHFTQVVWKSSERLGCAEAKGETYTFVVCNYDPPGNLIGAFETNVISNIGSKFSDNIKKIMYSTIFIFYCIFFYLS